LPRRFFGMFERSGRDDVEYESRTKAAEKSQLTEI
jgi:hypothetical protein